MIVRIIVVVRLPCVAVSIDQLYVDVSSLAGGGGGGSTAPGECIIPANADTVSVRLSATAAQLRRNLFIVVVLQSD
jgi:hypothetical protein